MPTGGLEHREWSHCTRELENKKKAQFKDEISRYKQSQKLLTRLSFRQNLWRPNYMVGRDGQLPSFKKDADDARQSETESPQGRIFPHLRALLSTTVSTTKKFCIICCRCCGARNGPRKWYENNEDWSRKLSQQGNQGIISRHFPYSVSFISLRQVLFTCFCSFSYT